MTVLVLAAETNRTADSVITGLTERNVPVVRVDTSWFPQKMSLDAEFRDDRCRGVLRTAHHEVDLCDIRSVWVRTPSAYSFPDTMSAAERDYARREAKIGMGGALLALPGVLWVNRPDLAATAVYRPLQWAVAARCGVTVPRSLVTNDPAAVQRFAAQSRTGVVVKPLTANLLYEDNTYKMGWTRKLSADDLADLRGVDATAHLVQDWVEKAWECRAVVVGNEVFAVAIHAGSEAARVDWRSDYPALSYEVIDLPPSVEKALRAIMDELGLVYGAFDLSVSNDGGSEVFWFLEINPDGQCGFLVRGNRYSDHRQPHSAPGERNCRVTVTVPESTWRELARRLADDINAMGKMYTPEWRAAVQEVPRHVFVPRYYTDDQQGRSRHWILHEPEDPDSVRRWLELVYSRTMLVTQVADFADRGTQAAVSSSTKPDLMIRMLEALNVTDGMRVLEIGTGTGYNAALLSHRLGAANVYSVDVDPQLVDDARDRLTRLGYTAATLAAVDGIEGLPEHAPYDRIIATCALFAVPATWINQLQPDGLALVHIEGPLGAGNLLALRHVAPDTVQGRFLPWWGCFMRRRPTAGPSVGTPRPRHTDAAPTTRTTTVAPAQLDGGARFPFLAQLHLPHGVFRSMWRRDSGDRDGAVTELRAPDGSWAEVTREPDPEARYRVREAGPTPLWAHVETAWEQWADLGSPQWHEFGLTATPTRHTVWFGGPDGPSWPLPVPDDTAESPPEAPR